MSHFAVVVIVPPGTEPTDVYVDRIEALLAPYDENLAVEAHEAECECVGLEAALATTQDDPRFDAEAAGLRVRSEAAYEADHPELREPFGGIHPSLCEEWDAIWRRRKARRAERQAAHPEAGKPRLDCVYCDGTGKLTTTGNDEGRWDWWQIGGRWTAFFAVPDANGDGYDPAMDPRNHERCTHCAPRPGKRFWREVPAGESHPFMGFVGFAGEATTVPAAKGEEGAREAPCNVCDGTGVARKWPTEWVDADTNYAPVERWAALLAAATHLPYAVVTADGRWHDQDGDWVATARALAAAAEPGSLAVIVDCHS